MNTISIITQNLNRNIQRLNNYHKEIQADIYAFQGMPKNGSVLRELTEKFHYVELLNAKEYNNNPLATYKNN